MALDNNYQNVIVGKSYVSLVHGIIQRYRHNSDNLVLDDDRIFMGGNWIENVGRMELLALEALGKEMDIPCLAEIDQYANQTNTMVFLDEKMIELGSSPYSNMKELARKLPERFSQDFIKALQKMEPETFDKQMDQFYRSVVEKAMDKNPPALKSIFTPETKKLEFFFGKFVEGIKNESLSSKQLHYVLQGLFQTILSNAISEVEARYLLAEILSPRYTLDRQRLEEELAFVYRSLGGDMKSSRAQEFQVYKSKVEYVLLESFEGALKTDSVELFGHFGKEFPFDYEEEQMMYHNIQIVAPMAHKFVSRFVGKRMIFSKSDRMGTDFPHLEVFIDEENKLRASFVYAEYQGSKPSFYFKNAAEDLFVSLSSLFPELDKDDWMSQIDFQLGREVWLDNVQGSLSENRLKLKSKLGSSCYFNGEKAQGVHYCGPLRARFLGFLGYIFNVLNS